MKILNKREIENTESTIFNSNNHLFFPHFLSLSFFFFVFVMCSLFLHFILAKIPSTYVIWIHYHITLSTNTFTYSIILFFRFNPILFSFFFLLCVLFSFVFFFHFAFFYSTCFFLLFLCAFCTMPVTLIEQQSSMYSNPFTWQTKRYSKYL